MVHVQRVQHVENVTHLAEGCDERGWVGHVTGAEMSIRLGYLPRIVRSVIRFVVRSY